jgi:sulfur carrier protein
VNVEVNGEPREVDAGTRVLDIVRTLGAGTGLGIAVAVNGEVVAKNGWAAATLEEGDRIEVLRAIGGG